MVVRISLNFTTDTLFASCFPFWAQGLGLAQSRIYSRLHAFNFRLEIAQLECTVYFTVNNCSGYSSEYVRNARNTVRLSSTTITIVEDYFVLLAIRASCVANCIATPSLARANEDGCVQWQTVNAVRTHPKVSADFEIAIRPQASMHALYAHLNVCLGFGGVCSLIGIAEI